MAVPVLASGTQTGGATVGTSYTATKPTGLASGDLCVVAAIVYEDAALAFAAPDGTFTQIGSTVVHSDGTSSIVLRVWWKIADGTEPASWSQSWGGIPHYWNALAFRVTGAYASGPIDSGSVGSSQGDGSSQATPAVTTAVADELAVLIKVGFGEAITGNPSGWGTPATTFDAVNAFYTASAPTPATIASANVSTALTDHYAMLAFAVASTGGGATVYPVPLLSSHTPFTTNYRGAA